MNVQDLAASMIDSARQFSVVHRGISRFVEDFETAAALVRELESKFAQIKLENVSNHSWKVTLTLLPSDEKAIQLATEWMQFAERIDSISESDAALAPTARQYKAAQKLYMEHTGITDMMVAYRAAAQTSGITTSLTF